MKILRIFLRFFVLLEMMSCCLAHRYGYSITEQRMWKKNHKHCNGRYQSPISIHSHRAIQSAMPAIEFIYYHNPLPAPLTINNNGYSVSLLPISSQNSSKHQQPYIFGGKLKDEYVYHSLHFHWGDKNSRGAEHLLNDVRHPLEMHLIHVNRKYATIEEALNYKDGLAVLAFFFQIRENLMNGEEIDHIVRNFGALNEMSSTVTLDYTFSLQALLGNVNTDRFYTYRGSLTTPKCNEAVTWIIFPDTIDISLSQMSKFRSLSNGIEGLLLVDNYRHLQPIRNRKIYLRSLSSRAIELEKLVEMEQNANNDDEDNEWFYSN